MVFIKVKHFYIKIYSKLLGSRKKKYFTEYFVTLAFFKTSFHCIVLGLAHVIKCVNRDSFFWNHFLFIWVGGQRFIMFFMCEI
jgi:hypothetical protein